MDDVRTHPSCSGLNSFQVNISNHTNANGIFQYTIEQDGWYNLTVAGAAGGDGTSSYSAYGESTTHKAASMVFASNHNQARVKAYTYTGVSQLLTYDLHHEICLGYGALTPGSSTSYGSKYCAYDANVYVVTSGCNWGWQGFTYVEGTTQAAGTYAYMCAHTNGCSPAVRIDGKIASSYNSQPTINPGDSVMCSESGGGYGSEALFSLTELGLTGWGAKLTGQYYLKTGTQLLVVAGQVARCSPTFSTSGIVVAGAGATTIAIGNVSEADGVITAEPLIVAGGGTRWASAGILGAYADFSDATVSGKSATLSDAAGGFSGGGGGGFFVNGEDGTGATGGKSFLNGADGGSSELCEGGFGGGGAARFVVAGANAGGGGGFVGGDAHVSFSTQLATGGRNFILNDTSILTLRSDVIASTSNLQTADVAFNVHDGYASIVLQ